MLICHSYIFFGELSIQIFFPLKSGCLFSYCLIFKGFFFFLTFWITVLIYLLFKSLNMSFTKIISFTKIFSHSIPCFFQIFWDFSSYLSAFDF